MCWRSIPSYEDLAVRIEFFGDEIERIVEIDPLTGEILGSAHARRHLSRQALGDDAGAAQPRASSTIEEELGERLEGA